MKLDRWDAVGAAGVLLVAYGAWLIYRPLGFILLGSVLLFVGIRAGK